MLGPRPSIFIASRDAKWIICSFQWQDNVYWYNEQRFTFTRRTAGNSHTGHVLGIVKGTSEPVRFSGTTRITSGMISGCLVNDDVVTNANILSLMKS